MHPVHACRPQTAPPLPQKIETVLTTDWDAVLGRDHPEVDKVPTADDLIDAAVEAAWDQRQRGDNKSLSAPPMSPLELRGVLKTMMQQSRGKLLPRSQSAEPACIETTRGLER